MENNDKIFRFINPKSNDTLSNFKGRDIQELLKHINNYYLELRNNLGLDNKNTFGLELEFENANRHLISYDMLDAPIEKDWVIKGDLSLENGAEINSPIFNDQKKSWEELKIICDIVKKYAVIGPHAGGHVHIGTQALGSSIQSLLNFLLIWSTYENVLFRFCYGDHISPRPSVKNYAKPSKIHFYKIYEKMYNLKGERLNEIFSLLRDDRYKAVNFVNMHLTDEKANFNTIEFRCPNATLDPVIWQNNVNVFTKLLELSKNTKIEERLDLMDKFESYSDICELCLYSEISIKEALEFCDLLFNNNLDKVYFLRQYTKSFDSEENGYSVSKKFTI